MEWRNGRSPRAGCRWLLWAEEQAGCEVSSELGSDPREHGVLCRGIEGETEHGEIGTICIPLPLTMDSIDYGKNHSHDYFGQY